RTGQARPASQAPIRGRRWTVVMPALQGRRRIATRATFTTQVIAITDYGPRLDAIALDRAVARAQGSAHSYGVHPYPSPRDVSDAGTARNEHSVLTRERRGALPGLHHR